MHICTYICGIPTHRQTYQYTQKHIHSAVKDSEQASDERSALKFPRATDAAFSTTSHKTNEARRGSAAAAPFPQAISNETD